MQLSAGFLERTAVAASAPATLEGGWPITWMKRGRLRTPWRPPVRGLSKSKRICMIATVGRLTTSKIRAPELKPSETMFTFFYHKRAKHRAVSVFPAMPDNPPQGRKSKYTPSLLCRLSCKKSFKGQQRRPCAYSCSSRGSHLIMYSL